VIESGNPNLPAHIDGSVENLRKWFHCTTYNVDQFVFGGFMNEVLTNIKTHPVPGDYNMHNILL